MLEGVAAKILSAYLGKYIEGLDKENLSVGISSGNVCLRNLRIRLDALKEINMPVVVRAGLIDSPLFLRESLYVQFLSLIFLSYLSGEIRELELKMPWKSLNSSPAIIRIEVLLN